MKFTVEISGASHLISCYARREILDTKLHLSAGLGTHRYKCRRRARISA
jgi:hypothetical protein